MRRYFLSVLLVITMIVHILAIVIYLGGTFFMDLLLVPALNRIPPAQAAIVSQRTGEIFAVTAWITLGLIAASGLTFLYLSGSLGLDLFLRPYGWLIGAKTFLFLLLVVNGLIMTIGIRPRLNAPLPLKTTESELKAKQADMMSAASTLNRLIRLNLIIASVAVILGVTLTFGGY
jgi:uncharacterized membrane protein